MHFVSEAWVSLKKTTGLLFPWRYFFTESWEGASLPTLFFIRAYGQTFKSATTSYFWKLPSTFFSSLIL